MEYLFWTPQEGMVNLNTASNASSLGLTIQSAPEVNDSGEIVANAVDSNNQNHALLLTPYNSLKSATVATVTAAPPVADFPAPNELLRDLPSLMNDDGTDFSTPTQESIGVSQQLLGALAAPLSNQFLKDTAFAAGQNLHSVGMAGTLILAGTNPNPLASAASLALMTAPNTLDTVTLKSLLQLPNLVKLADYTWGTSGGEPYQAAFSFVNFSYGTILANELEAFGSDPVDPDYQVIVTPAALPDAINHLPSTGNSAVDSSVATSLDAIFSASSYLEAANDTLDKYAGALQGNDPLWASAQLGAMTKSCGR
jgi:hypothetical protein